MTVTEDVGDDFFPRLREVALGLAADARDMLAVMYSESGCRADAHNDSPKTLPPARRYNASGLIQFMPTTLERLGWTAGHTVFRRLSATDQLSFVRRYYRPYRGHLGSVAGLYVATFLPAFVSYSSQPNFVLTARGGPLGWAYTANSALDADGDLRITVGELAAAVRRNARGPRWAELLARLEQSEEVEPAQAPPDLGAIVGVQQALRILGYDPGPVDGLAGPRTRAAVLAFQKANPPLAPDGIYGPKTRAALAAALTTAKEAT